MSQKHNCNQSKGHSYNMNYCPITTSIVRSYKMIFRDPIYLQHHAPLPPPTAPPRRSRVSPGLHCHCHRPKAPWSPYRACDDPFFPSPHTPNPRHGHGTGGRMCWVGPREWRNKSRGNGRPRCSKLAGTEVASSRRCSPSTRSSRSRPWRRRDDGEDDGDRRTHSGG